jgi:DNA invertase Pin-like site-specific DNA recombinase
MHGVEWCRHVDLTKAGTKRAREAGIRFGRPPKLTRHKQEHALKLLDAGEPQSAVARALNVDQSTISRLAAARSNEAGVAAPQVSTEAIGRHKADT